MGEPIKVGSPKRLLEESLHVAWSQACLELGNVIYHFKIDVGKVELFTENTLLEDKSPCLRVGLHFILIHLLSDVIVLLKELRARS